MISIDRLKEMAIEELETKLNNWKEQVELQSNFIDSLLKATNNFEWLNKTILDDEASEIIEKIELDYVQLDELKAENEDLKIYIESNEQQVKEVETLVMDNDRLINELDQLKEQLEAYKMEAEEGKEINAELKAENKELKKEINNKYSVSNFNVIFMREHIHNLKQTLTKIKEICNNNDELKGDFNLVDCDKYKLGKHNLANRILQKISECEGNDVRS